jgi:peptide-methionine (S)-S-oxide reductase
MRRALGLLALFTLTIAAGDHHARTTSRRDEVAIFAGGCFWGIEAVFNHVKGVKSAGSVASPGYEDVSSGATGHAESVKVTFDASVVSYETLLRVFFASHDPTQLNRQGPDVGTQYRSAIFYVTDDQRRAAESYIQQLNAAKTYRHPIVTRVEPYRAFYVAEAYHQGYAMSHPTDPYIATYDLPKLAALQKLFPELYR